MAKTTYAGSVPSDDPMFTNTFQAFSPHGSKRLTGSSHKSTDSKQTHKLNKALKHHKPFSQMSDKEREAYMETLLRGR